MAREAIETTNKKVEAPECIWVDIREDSGNDYDPGCNAQWMPAGSWKPADDGENESDWALYVRAGTPSTTRQRAERAARRLHDQRLTVVGAWSTPESAIQQVADIIAAEFEK